MINKLPKFWRKDASFKTITIHGKKWFDRVNGNTYHSVRATVNQGMKNEFSLICEWQYGYDDHYIQTVREKLVKMGAVSDYHKISDMILKGKLTLTAYADDVKKSEMIQWGKE